MSQEPHDDAIILAVLEALEDRRHGRDGEPLLPPAGSGPEAETLLRLYSEAVGLVPVELEPVNPSPEVRQRLLATIAGDETQEVPQDVMLPRPPARLEPAAVPLAPVAPPLPTAFARVEPRRPARRWPLALAAALAVAFLGLSAWLFLGLLQQDEQISRLAAQLEEQRQRVRELESAGAELAALRDRLGLVVSPAVEVCPLRPPSDAAPQPHARGVLFVAADHQHWYLSVQGLAPAGPGRSYQLWFIADGRPVPAGTFEAEPDTPVDLSSETMPRGTKGVAITLEPEGGRPQPTGPEVLRDAGVFQVL